MNKSIIGFISGVFDGPEGLHEGHRYILSQARLQCDSLVVSVNCDDYIRKTKGREPCMNAEKRAEAILDLKDENGNDIVDAVFIRDEDSPLNSILKLKPDIIFAGGDYHAEDVIGYNEIKLWGGKVVIIERLPNISTTEILLTNQKNSVT